MVNVKARSKTHIIIIDIFIRISELATIHLLKYPKTSYFIVIDNNG